MITIRPVLPEDADALFPMVYQTAVTDTLVWNGPESLEEYRAAIARSSELTTRGERFAFTIVEVETGQPVGSCSIRPGDDSLRADLGFWIGEAFHGKGYGTQLVRLLVNHGFGRMHLEKIDGFVYTGNPASRRIFEKNGFLLEATIRKAMRKRGEWQNDWMFGITREDWLSSLLVHICPQSDWNAALQAGAYRAASLEEAGFIHLSKPEQALGTANRFYLNQHGLVLLWIDPWQVQSEVRYEPAENELFPHLYGALDLQAVVLVKDFPPAPNGDFTALP